MLLTKKPILTFKHPNQYKCLIYKEKTAISDGLYSVAYVKQNIANKLVQLAQYNNREFKKLLREEADTSIVMDD